MENIKIGLAGNPNVGKTTLFNNLTGLHQHVGNWPGKTVEQAVGHFEEDNKRFEVIDLPGNYALSAHSIEEIVSRDFIVDEESDAIINIVDAANLERNLYLTVQMMELNANMGVCLNMNKIARKNGITVDVDKLSELLGVPVIEIEANSDVGHKDLLKMIEDLKNHPINSKDKLVYGNELKEHLQDLVDVISKDKNLLDVSAFWTAIKLLEDDEIVMDKVQQSSMSNPIFLEVRKVKDHLKDIYGVSAEEVIADARYAYIDGLINECVKLPENRQLTLSEKIDKVVTNRILGIPIFLIIMWVVFQVTFTIGAPFQDLLDAGFTALGDAVTAGMGENMISSLLVDGVIGGVGSVLSFVPQIILLFLLLSLLEDSGYLARAAFVMDRVMHKVLGLHGKAFIPMILGFGCGVPGIMATRTMEHEEDRLVSMMLIPFMSCTARLPVYLMFVGIFFASNQGNVIFSLYLLGVIVAIIVAAILKKSLFKGVSTPFVMELPSYKLPTLRGVLMHTGEKTWGFVRKAGTIILAAAIIVWVLSYFPAGVEYGSQASLIGQIGTVIAPVFSPLGFGNWQAAVALLFGMVAKEVVVATLTSVLGGSTAALATIFTPLTAYAFMVFVLLYIPCFATIGTIKQESNGWRWPLIMVCVTLVTAFIVSFLVFHVGLLLGFH
ncbi:ferrous iron transport protein B [Methanobrevibacter boviskoreani]|uniref:ferrous iron transport protein B n=1 Tax=Methanobrevibacter boviskoreani TaxID=1348249 RepID=UPI0023A8AA25|nr:ferrous iron transport protein B [Methanobrevibacter boviskoreani]MCI6775243.1 ferrous iron transport protein B [Methanobrevibacter boviskoreani]MDY5614647.1 ferrous iron transport protein B [Methanobrevibacter boviskoreani]